MLSSFDSKKIEMKRNVDRDLKADIWNFLEELQKNKPQEVYESQEFYLDALRLLFNSHFRQRIKALREHFEVPLEWYNYPQSKEPHYKDLFEIKEKYPDAPQREFDEVIVDLCGEFGLNPLRYGWFVLYYLYYANLSVGIEQAEGLIVKEEFRRKARIVIKRNNYSSKDKSFERPHQSVGYIQFYKDTTPTGIEDFIRDNKEIIEQLQKVLAPYPPIEKIRSKDTCKRDIEIFLLTQLDFGDSDIRNILANEPLPKQVELIEKSFATLTNGNVTLLQRKYLITKRKDEDIHHITESSIRGVVKGMRSEVFGKNDKSVDKVDP